MHVRLSEYYGLLQGMKIHSSPNKIIDCINEYFGVNIRVNKRNKGYSLYRLGTYETTQILRQSVMKIFRENLGMKDEEIAPLFNCNRTNVVNLLKKFNLTMPVNSNMSTLYKLSINIIAKNLHN